MSHVILRKKKPKRRIWKDLPWITMVVIILLSSIVGVIYFHSINLEKAPDYSDKYDPYWFSRNDRSQRPPDLSDLIKPPPRPPPLPPVIPPNIPEIEDPEKIFNPDMPERIDFVIDGMVPPLAWKIKSYDVYMESSGWGTSSENLVTYAEATGGDFSFRVRKVNTLVQGEMKVNYIWLWTPENQILASDFNVARSNVSQVILSEYQTDINQDLVGVITTTELGDIDIEYYVYGTSVDSSEVELRSSSVGVVQNLIVTDEYLQHFVALPDGYFDRNPNARDARDYLYLGPSATIYDQVLEIGRYLIMNFELSTTSAPSGEDPVNWFIGSKRGMPIYYAYTMAVLLRGMGIPTRICIGYIFGEYDSAEDVTYLRARNLYMWVEVYDPGNNGWVPFDCIPTPKPADPINLIQTGIAIQVFVGAPRFINGYPAVYLDEEFTIGMYFIGPGAADLSGSVDFWEINESELLGSSPIIAINETFAMAGITTTYENFYTYLGRDPLYGIHQIEILYQDLRIPIFIVLLASASIG
ncbi:MAG: transglutaminase-like domain-containing protein [Candidatus Njordarchaeia archaeon]|nr:transglutaminase domain-containing protein [Candidatus Korarchaeota archaeon]